jgi:hypothetical protein
VVAVACGLGACAHDKSVACEPTGRYATATSAAPVRIPDDLNPPDETDSLRLPPETGSAVARTKPCLESPPGFYADGVPAGGRSGGGTERRGAQGGASRPPAAPPPSTPAAPPPSTPAAEPPSTPAAEPANNPAAEPPPPAAPPPASESPAPAGDREIAN